MAWTLILSQSWAAIALAAADPAEPGPYGVGVVTLSVPDRWRDDRFLTVELWYPTAPAKTRVGRYPSGALTRAIRNAKPATGPFPWLVFSHGLSAVREQSTFLTEHLASHGYVVASADHEDRVAFTLNPADLYQAGLDRPQDVHLVIDRVLAWAQEPGSLLCGRLHEGALAVAGHSLGAYTALAVGGAWVNVSTYPGKADDPSWPDYRDFGDRRVKAVVAFTPFCQPAFDPPGLARLRRPTLIVGAGTDVLVTPYARDQVPIYEHVGGPCYLALIEGASHLSFINEELIQKLPFVVRLAHQQTISSTRCYAMVRRLTLAFLDRHLLGRDRYAAFLADKQPGLQIRVQHQVTSNSCR